MPPHQTGQWHYLYGRSTWVRRAKAQLRENPLCSMCLSRGIISPATICDHVEPHHGDHWLFYNGAVQSLCKPCHDGRKKREEKHGYQRDIGVDGWPLDPRHPANKPRP
jgi:5-methylcytosine-specific restriction protein A